MKLIIAEKPSLARNIASAIGSLRKNAGYMEGEGYIVTWGFGHLFALCDIEDYTGATSTGRWTRENIPCFPESFRYQLRREAATHQVDEGVQRQYDIIAALCNRDDVDCIINAGDADREGEIIVRTCVKNALKSEKPQKRLWLPDQTAETVRAALNDLKDEREYDNLANEGYARTFIDWVYGVNLTRYSTLKAGTLLRVGRVIVPIVKAIYERDMAIRNFTSETYFVPYSNEKTGDYEVELISKNKYDKNSIKKCEALCSEYNALGATVTDKKSKKDALNPGKLYSLSKLQNVLGKKYKISMDDSLKIVQSLYEKGYLTYPRTNSEYLASAEKDKVKNIIDCFSKIGYPVEFKDKKTIFDDSKIESHSALTPTHKIPKKEHLSDEEFKVYQTVVRRFVAVFCSEECLAQKTEIKVSVGDKEEFLLKGTAIITPGWTKYDDSATKNKLLPPLEVGDRVNISFAPKERETSPPKHYTIETLNNYLKNPFREEKAAANDMEAEDDAEEYRAMFEGLELGTEATRTGIIENAIKSNYIQLKKDVYTILPGGEFLIESLVRLGINMDKYKTSTIGKALKAVFRGNMTVDQSVELAKKEISEVFNRPAAEPDVDTDIGFYGDTVGVCPVCGSAVKRGRYSYGCERYKDGCTFKIPLTLCRRTISISNAKLLLGEKKTGEIKGFISKAGKEFNAPLKLDTEQNRVVFDFKN